MAITWMGYRRLTATCSPSRPPTHSANSAAAAAAAESASAASSAGPAERGAAAGAAAAATRRSRAFTLRLPADACCHPPVTGWKTSA